VSESAGKVRSESIYGFRPLVVFVLDIVIVLESSSFESARSKIEDEHDYD
jgi:hypothetical protein